MEDNIIFTIMYQNEAAAEVLISNDKKKVEIRKLIPDSLKQPLSGSKLDLERIYDFLKSRCYEDGRADLQEILDLAGLQSITPGKWMRITHGGTDEDMFWIKFPGEDLRWEDIKVR